MSENNNYTAEYLVNQARADYTNRVSNAKQARDMWVFLRENQDLFPDMTGYKARNVSYYLSCYIGSMDFQVRVPWDTVLADEVMCLFTNLGWTVYDQTDYIRNYKEITYRLKHPVFEGKNIRVIVDMNATLAGSKCKLIVDHIEKRDVEIYRVECEDTINV